MAAEAVWTFIYLCILNPVPVVGYYCDSDKCGEGEYCCGSNICCTSFVVWQMWYFWCGIVLFVIMLSACAGFCRYRYYDQPLIIQSPGPYSKLSSSHSSVHDIYPPGQGQVLYSGYSGKSSSYDADIRTYSQDYPPPPYSSTASHKEKDPTLMR